MKMARLIAANKSLLLLFSLVLAAPARAYDDDYNEYEVGEYGHEYEMMMREDDDGYDDDADLSVNSSSRGVGGSDDSSEEDEEDEGGAPLPLIMAGVAAAAVVLGSIVAHKQGLFEKVDEELDEYADEWDEQAKYQEDGQAIEMKREHLKWAKHVTGEGEICKEDELPMKAGCCGAQREMSAQEANMKRQASMREQAADPSGFINMESFSQLWNSNPWGKIQEAQRWLAGQDGEANRTREQRRRLDTYNLAPGDPYTDREFPGNMESLGAPDWPSEPHSWPVKALSGFALDKPDLIAWKRVGGNDLWVNAIQPDDITQGSMGNCWLIAAIASFAEFPDYVKNIFIDQKNDGRYEIQLYNKWTEHFDNVVVDDKIPHFGAGTARFYKCQPNGMPKLDPQGRKMYFENCKIFAKPNGNETWVMILEKAFAKWCGGYLGLDAGHPVFALQAFTGDKNPIAFAQLTSSSPNPTDRKWVDRMENPSGGRTIDIQKGHRGQCVDRKADCTSFKYYPNQLKDLDYVWAQIYAADQENAVICCSSTGNDDTKTMDGIVTGHAFTLIQCVESGWDDSQHRAFRLCKIRNPHGQTEPKKLKWSDNSRNWTDHPDVAAECGHDNSSHVNDGIFWLCMDELPKYFVQISICRWNEGDASMPRDIPRGGGGGGGGERRPSRQNNRRRRNRGR